MTDLAWRDRRWLAPFLLLLVAVAARAQTFGNPVLGYDEQFYLLVGDRLIHGALPFVDIFDRKPIGLFLIFAAIRELGGEGTIQYELVALSAVVATALLIHRFARRLTGEFGAIAAALAYILWLDFLEGEGGQAPVWFNLPMLGAALIVERLIRSRRVTPRSGIAPMLLVGMAIQIKYTALFEGLFFGCAMLMVEWRNSGNVARLAAPAAAWVGAAVLPTLLAYGTYVALGHGQEFLFANFLSMWGKLGDPLATSVEGLATIAGIFLPILGSAVASPAATSFDQARSRRFARHWLLAAIGGLLAMRSFSTPQYAIPMLVPALLTAAPLWGERYRRPFVIAGLMIALVASQLVLWSLQNLKGRAREATIIARAATPVKGCLFVYDGYPALYRLTRSCLLSRFVFPGHLNMSNEDNSSALGVDPVVEVRRIMAMRPETVTMDDPPFERVNQRTYAVMRQLIARDYRLVMAFPTGDRHRLVYRRR